MAVPTSIVDSLQEHGFRGNASLTPLDRGDSLRNQATTPTVPHRRREPGAASNRDSDGPSIRPLMAHAEEDTDTRGDVSPVTGCPLHLNPREPGYARKGGSDAQQSVRRS